MGGMNTFLKHYGATLLLLAGIALGALCGILWPEAAHAVKPVGSLFLNLVFVMVVPLVFFSTASSICKLRGSGMLGRTLVTILAVFLGMSLVAALAGLLGTARFPLVLASEWDTFAPNLPEGAGNGTVPMAEAIVGALTASDFSLLLSKEHLLALVIFSAAVRDDGLEAAVGRFADELKALGAEIESTEALGRRTFARTLAKRDAGLYAKVRFDAEPDAIAKMRERFRLYEDTFRIQFRTRNLRVEAAKAKDDARRAAYMASVEAKAAAAAAAAEPAAEEPAGEPAL